RVLNDRGPRIRSRSRELLQSLLEPAKNAHWTVGLLDVLQEVYYEQDPDGLYKMILRPIIVDGRVPAAHAVRAELLSRVSAGQFPPEAGKRWSLAWAAAGEVPLGVPIRLTGQSPAAVTFLGGVCRGLLVP